MSVSSLPAAANDTARLRELRQLGLLDTPGEQRFNQYTRLVADVLGVSMALISLVDEQRQWFKSALGIALEQTERETSFCAHALPLEFLEVPDTWHDERFRDNPLVTGPPYVRFYAGAVLHGPTGQPLGTLCVLGYEPRRLSADEKSRVLAFAGLVEQEINLHQRFHALEERLQRAAFHDPVTGLPGRGLLETHLERSVREARDRGDGLLVMHVQLVNCEILATLEGQQGVDTIMQALTTRLRNRIRPTDQIGRLGNDRFLLILPGRDIAELASSDRLVDLVRGIASPIRVNGRCRQVKLAAGVSRYPEDATTSPGLMDCAQAALRQRSNGDTTIFNYYSRAIHDRASQHYDKLYRLAEALRKNRLEQVYQPIVAFDDGRMIGVEALARWQDEVYGNVSPGEFIPLIEADARMRRKLTRWSLETACQRIADWRQKSPCGLCINVNIPGGELYQSDFADLVRDTLDRFSVSPDALVLELTEQSLIRDIDAAVSAIQSLRGIGVCFAIDDFGTGYSSLNYLKQLPLDTVKIDRSFIRDIVADETTRELTRGILDIARALRLSVVAEGIETDHQHRTLRQMACAYAQGFLFSRPVSAETITRKLCGR